MITDYTKMALKNLRKRKLRSWLTLLGIFISIATIILLIGLSQGLDRAVKEEFKKLGTDKFFIFPKGQAGAPGAGGAVELTINDIDVIKKVGGVKVVTYFIAGTGKVEYNKKIRYVSIAGIELENEDLFLQAGSREIIEGRELKNGDVDSILVGSQYQLEGFLGKPVEVGKTIIVNDQEFKVRGVLSSTGSPPDDQMVFFSEQDFRNLLNIPTRVDEIMIQVDEGEDINAVADRVEKRLMNSRGLTEKTIDFSISTPEELLASFGSILNIITAFLFGVAAISLLVGSIGIANTMYTSVLERTREIGTMKAIGAKNSDILLIFLIESGLLGLVGGLIGILIGIGAGKIIEKIAQNALGTDLLQVYFGWELIIGCILFSFLIGSLSGLLPALRAEKLKPVEALRYE